MKKFLGLILAAGLMSSAGLFAADAGSSSDSASSSGGPEDSDGSVTLIAHGAKIKLSHEQIDLLDSRTIEVALAAGMAESKTREIELLEEFDVTTVQTLADILTEIAKTGSFDTSVVRWVTRKNVLHVLSMLDYLQAERLENVVFERLFELGVDLRDHKSAYCFLSNLAQTCPNVIDKVFTPQVIVPNLRCGKTLKGHVGPVRSVSWSPDGKSLAGAGDDTTVRVWNVATGESRELTGHTNSVFSVSWSPDGKSLASASGDHTVRVWNVANGESRALTGHTHWVTSVSWSPDGKSLASASCDNTVRVWNVANGESRELTGLTDGVYSVCWSPDGKSLASASFDYTVCVWGNSELDACTPFQKLFILINLPKKPKTFERATLWFSKLLERIGLCTGDDKSTIQWLGVYQSLPEQAKKLLAKGVKEKFEYLILSNALAFGTDRTRKDQVKSAATTMLKTSEESILRKIGLLMLQHKPVEEVLRFFAQHEKEFGDRAEDVLSDIKRYAAGQEKERGGGASSSGASSSKS